MNPDIPLTQAMAARRSIRAFRPDPVPRETIETILLQAGRAPSGSNIQPWKVIVATGAPLQALTKAAEAKSLAGDPPEAEYHYYPRAWREPYLARRRKVGWDLYGALGLTRENKAGMRAQHARNYRFFDAPVGLIFTMDRDMEIGAWLDLGMYMQNAMLAALAHGLATCPQAAWATWPALVADHLAIPPDRQVICGMALGVPDMEAPENRFPVERMAPEDFIRWVG